MSAFTHAEVWLLLAVAWAVIIGFTIALCMAAARGDRMQPPPPRTVTVRQVRIAVPADVCLCDGCAQALIAYAAKEVAGIESAALDAEWREVSGA